LNHTDSQNVVIIYRSIVSDRKAGVARSYFTEQVNNAAREKKKIKHFGYANLPIDISVGDPRK